ncbi:MAG: hypothetical protein LLG04_10955 [Parachlamydia sp.]|nr:hypothetical protein [Parachlamydia sp.]
MALETLAGLTEIGGFGIARWPEERDAYNPYHGVSIIIDDENNSIQFKIQNGPIKEVGVNGCQVDTLIETAFIMIEKLNEKFPCEENKQALNYLSDALNALAERRTNRERRGVEGTSQL